MRNNQNVILDNFEKIPNSKAEFYNDLKSIMDTIPKTFYQDEDIIAKLIENKEISYLIVQRPECIKVLASDNRSNKFYGLDLKNDVYYGAKVLSLPNLEHQKKDNDEFLETLDGVKEKIKKVLIKINNDDVKIKYPVHITQYPFLLNNFFETIDFFSKDNFLSRNNKTFDFLNENENNIDIDVLNFKLDKLYNATIENKFTVKNKFVFNDLDNYLWKQKDKLFLSSQNFTFIANKKDNNWNIYIAPFYDKTFKKHISIKSLIDNINKDTVNNINNGVLIFKDNKLVFTDPSIIGSLLNEVSYNLDALEDEGLVSKETPPGLKKLSPNEYITNSIYVYPTLYLKYSFEQSKIAVLDHMFNTIGSGTDDFIGSITGKPVDFKDIENWFGDSKIYECEKNGKRIMTFDIKDKEDFDTYQIEKNKNYYCSPYPNFKKEYSLIYSSNYELMNDDWKQAALDFYNYAKDYFQDPNKRINYHYAFEFNDLSSLTNKQKNLISDVKKRIETLPIEKISKDYEVEFIGNPSNDKDIADFLKRRWLIEKDRIEKFIDETISMIETDLKIIKKPKI